MHWRIKPQIYVFHTSFNKYVVSPGPGAYTVPTDFGLAPLQDLKNSKMSKSTATLKKEKVNKTQAI
jgi:hypothetical protein